MSIETHVDSAIERVDREIEHFEDRLAGVKQFERKLQAVEPVQRAGTGGTDGGVRAVSAGTVTSSTADPCQKVLDIFAETVYPHSASQGEETVLETLGEELNRQVALALAPETAQGFTPAVKRTVSSGIADRAAEIESMQRALDAERNSLAEARADIDEITAWLNETDQTPLLDLDFDQLRARHATLGEYLDRCEAMVQSRQQTVHSTTSQAGAAGVDHHQLVEFLYESFPVSYPVLATVANLEELCQTSERRVRDHLVRRV